MSPWWRKATLTVHIASSVGWLGAIAAYVALNVPALAAEDPQVIRAAYLMMEPVAYYAVVPLALASTLTGLFQGLATPWGLFRHYWVLISLMLTVFATSILLLHLPAISEMADTAATQEDPAAHLSGDVFHSVGGLIVLAVPLVLNIYKPRGLTPYGWRALRKGQQSQ